MTLDIPELGVYSEENIKNTFGDTTSIKIIGIIIFVFVLLMIFIYKGYI